jgi:UDP-glucose 4-epimerase
MALLNVLQECLKNPTVKRLVFASSAAVYGNPQFLPITEEHPTNPISNYGVGKLACEFYLRAACKIQKHLDTVSLRFFNVFGPGQSEDSSYAGVITKFVSAIKSGSQLVIYGDGKQTRDFIPVQVIAAACHDVMIYKNHFSGEAINVGSGKPLEINELLKMLEEVLHQRVVPVYKNGTSFEIKESYAENKKIKLISNIMEQKIAIGDFLRGI